MSEARETLMHDLTIECGEIVVIGADIEVSLVGILGDRVRLGIIAPREIIVHRKEVYDAIKRGDGEATRVKAQGQAVVEAAKPTLAK